MPQPQSRSVLVFDVGGSHISAAVCAESTYTLTGISRAPLPADGLNVSAESHSAPAFKFVRLIHALAERAAHSAGLTLAEIAGASLAMPGPFDYENGISHMEHKLQSLKGIDLKAALAARFAWEPDQFRFVNDAAAFTLGEAGAGAAKGHSRAVGITLGTGIGCAFSIDGKIAPSEPGNREGVPPGGEIWNLPYNGKTVEDFVSTRYLRQHFQSLTGLQAEVSAVAAIADCEDNAPCVPLEELVAKESQPRSFESTEGGATASPAQHMATAAHTPGHARQSFSEFGQHLGLALNEHAAAFHPDVIVLGGGIARASNLFLPATKAALTFPAKLAISTLMDEAPLAGAGVQWFASS